MLGIIDALKNKDNSLRLSNGSKWLIWDNSVGWQVMSREYNQKKTRILIETFSEEDAVEMLTT